MKPTDVKHISPIILKKVHSTGTQLITYEALPVVKNSAALNYNDASSRLSVLKENHSTKQVAINDHKSGVKNYNINAYLDKKSSKYSSHHDGNYPYPRTDSHSQRHKSKVPKYMPSSEGKRGNSSDFNNLMENIAVNDFKSDYFMNANIINSTHQIVQSANKNYRPCQTSKLPPIHQLTVPSYGDKLSDSKSSTKTMSQTIDTAAHRKHFRNSDQYSPNVNPLPQQLSKSPSVPLVAMPSPVENLNSRNSSNTDPKDKDGNILTDIEALKMYRCVKISDVRYSIKVITDSKDFSFGWEICRSFPLRSTSSDQSKLMSNSDTNMCKRKLNYEGNSLLSRIANGRGTESNKGSQSTSSIVPNNAVVHSSYLKQTNDSHSSVMKQLLHSSVGSAIRKPICDKKSTIDDSTMYLISSKKERMPIYSGRKRAQDESTMYPISSKKERMPVYSGRKRAQDIKLDENQTSEKLVQHSEQCSPIKLRNIEVQNKKAFEKEQRRLKSVTSRINNGIPKWPSEWEYKLIPIDFDTPERPVKPEVNEGQINSATRSHSSSSSRLFAQKSFKDSKTAKKNILDIEAVAPLMSKARKMAAEVAKHR